MNEWIPVSERLPKGCGEVLVTYRNEDSEERLVTVGRFEGCEWLIDDYVYPTIEVIAWMPLPESYKGGK